MKYETNNQEFKWLSEGVPYQKRGKKIRHTSFALGTLKVNVGDFVLVRNDDALDPEDVLDCFVAQVKDLFDNGDDIDPNHAHVQWFLRISELPKYVRKYLNPEESDWEVLQDESTLWSLWSKDINAETIFQRCEVLFLPVDADWETSLSQYDDHPFPVFFCRYLFLGKTVAPVLKQEEPHYVTGSKNSVLTPVSKKTNKMAIPKRGKPKNKTEDLYCAQTVGDSFNPKVLIKRINIGLLENVEGNSRIFVTNPANATIGDISDSFRNKVEIQKYSVKTAANSVVHSLTKLHSSPKKQSCKKKLNAVVEEHDIFSKNWKSTELKVEHGTKDNISSTKKRPSSKIRNSSKISSLTAYSSKCPSPQKKAKVIKNVEIDDFATTRSGRKVKVVSYSEEIGLKGQSSHHVSPSKKKIPRFVCDTDSDDSNSCHFLSEDDSSSDSALVSDCSLQEFSKTHSKNRKRITQKKTPKRVSKKVDINIPERKTPLKAPKNVLEETRQRLHVSAVPSSLPCREEEYSDIYSFVKGCLCAQTGGCMYISGVPGTGKTATVHEVIRNLEEEKESGEVPLFTFVEVNGMWMTDPYQCYVHIFKALSGKTIAPQQAASLLEKKFTERGPKKEAVVLLVDELDRLWTRKQTVMYNIFDWPSKVNSKLIVLAIANTMDLPERMMMNRISSRIGLTRKTFQPYTFKQLQEIIMSRIQELKVFDPDAVQLVARKVAALSGDARRALDICRFATEVIKQENSPKKKQKVLVGMEQVDTALQQIFSSPIVSAIRSCSKISKMFFQCLLSEFTRSGLEETTLVKVYKQVVACCRFEGIRPPNSSEIFNVCTNLATSHLILVDDFCNDLHMKIRLNISSDDVTYALSLH